MFFVTSLITSGLFSGKKSVTQKGIITGALILQAGFAVSAVLTVFSADSEIPFYINLSLTVLGLYLAFFSVIHLMNRQSKNPKNIKLTAVISTVLPSLASVNNSIGISPLFTILLLFFAFILLTITTTVTKKDAKRHP